MGLLLDDLLSGSGGADDGALSPISRARIMASLEAQGWPYEVDADGDVGFGADFGSFFFFVNGESDEFLCVMGNWHGRLTVAERGEALELCNSWNSDQLWPKAYVRTEDDGAVIVQIEHNIDFDQGASDGQLTQQILCAVGTGMMFFEQVSEAFPAVWERYRPLD